MVADRLVVQPVGIGDRQRDPIPRVAAEVVPGRRDREGAARAGGRRAGVDMAFVQEVDVPDVGARGQHAVVRRSLWR